jgi:hypothetical protein
MGTLRTLGLLGLLTGLLLGGALGASAAGVPGAPSSAHPIPSGPHPSSPTTAPLVLPPRAGHHLVPRGAGSGVDPYAYYSSEPAPMGLADFGVDSNQNPYAYTTNEFQAMVTLHSLSTYDSNDGSAGMTVQLNVVLQFTYGGSPYYYWVQDVGFIDTSSNALAFENNIWNFSGTSGVLTTGSLSGNGSIYSSGLGDFYYDGAAGSLPGSSVTLSYPQTIGLRVLSGMTAGGGYPTVRFEYSDGYGWVTYDVVTFSFALGATGANYTVDGYGYNPLGIYNDAELIFGGPGNGASTTASAADATLSLEYNNSHNLQEITNAFDFGSDTGETISGVYGNLAENPVNGTLTSLLKTSGNGPASLYDRGYSSIVNISSPDPAGTLEVNSTYGVAFRGSDINLTLGPGTYTFTGYVDGIDFDAVSATVGRGVYLALRLGGQQYSLVQFVESGLPNGTLWSLTLGGVRNSSSTPIISFSEPVGSYAYSVGLVNGYLPSPTGGTVKVSGQDQTLDITWSQAVYSLEFSEVGLPANTLWGVDFNGTPLTSHLTSFVEPEPNGSYSWHALLVAGYTPAPRAGVVPVAGGAVSVRISWTRTLYSVGFHELGLPATDSWSVTLNGASDASSLPAISFEMPNGTYSFLVAEEDGYAPSPAAASVNVTGSDVTVHVNFALIEGRLAGDVSPGTATLTVNGTTITLENGTYSVDLPPATYTVVVTSSGYLNYTALVVVSPGSQSYLNVSLTPVPAPPLVHTSQPTAFPSLLVGGLALAALAAIALAIALSRRRRA